ncbi:hypothetical protein A2U01_0118148, partial [Trifolium medium]|nr:hypothetical protein [Trifolium medium]
VKFNVRSLEFTLLPYPIELDHVEKLLHASGLNASVNEIPLRVRTVYPVPGGKKRLK